MKTRGKIYIKNYYSPCGRLILGAYADRLCLCNWLSERHPGRIDNRLQRLLVADYVECATSVTDEAARQLDLYFIGRQMSFTVPLLFVGTAFQQEVWRRLMDIPYGHTVSYGELARRLGCPWAVRAVANANGANSISVFVPCHRVVGSDGSLTGYVGGIDIKRFLLELESNRHPMNNGLQLI